MSSSAVPGPAPPSPGLASRRRGPKGQPLPTLPLSAFSPPNTGTSDKFPLPPSPSTIHPQKVIDANVIAPTGDLTRWQKEIRRELQDDKVAGVIVNLTGVAPGAIEKTVAEVSALETSIPIVALLVPFSLEEGIPASPPSYLSSRASSQPPIILASTYSKSTPKAAEALDWALTKGHSVDLDIQADLRDGEGAWEALEEFFASAIPRSSPLPKGKVFLSNLLPPPDDFSLPIVKLLTHPTYQAYQSHTAALSLYANVFIKFLPPVWGTATPPTPAATQSTTPGAGSVTPGGTELPSRDTKEKREWKRRIKMYIGPALEAFGYQRIIYGSSPSPLSHASSHAGDWYELARESFAELGVEQEGVDAVFHGNAKRAFSHQS